MDDPSILLGILLLIALIFGLPAAAFVRSGKLKKRVKSLEAENEALRNDLRSAAKRLTDVEQSSTPREELRHLIQRVYALEHGGAVPAAEPLDAAKPPAAEPAPGVPPREEIVAKEVPATPQRPEIPKPPAHAPEIAASAAPPPPKIAPPQTSQPAPVFSTAQSPPLSQPQETHDKRGWADLEEKLGTNWLNKIGTAAFVIGVAMLLNYSMHYLGATGKITLGYALSAAFLAAGIIGEKKERYRIASRAVLGGGWALAYFTTYALHNIASVRLVSSPELGFALLFAVAAAMVAHSLLYHSEVTTGFAYLLAYASVAVSQIPIGALIASALLAASLVVILRLRRWYTIEPFAIVANYIVHYIWLMQIYAAMGARKPFPEFRASVALLTSYWLIYLISYFLRSEAETDQARLLTASFLANAGGYLVVLHEQAFHPEWRFWFLLGSGMLYLAVCAYARRVGRRWGYILASTLGVTLMVAAVPYRYSGRGLEIFWLIEAQALLVLGWRMLDAHLRRLGWFAATLLSGYVLVNDLMDRVATWRPPNASLGWLLLLMAAALFFDSRLQGRLGDGLEIEDAVAEAFSAVATLFLLCAAWVALPFFWTGLVWVATAVAVLYVGRALRDRMLAWCGHAASLVAIVRLLVINLPADQEWHSISLRLVTVGFSAALLYLASALYPVTSESCRETHGLDQPISRALHATGGLRGAYSAAATFLMALLVWHQITSAAIALTWSVFALVLLEVGRALNDRPLRIQSHLLLLASFVQIFVGDLNSLAKVGPLPARVLTVSFLAGVFYFAAYESPEKPWIRKTLLWFGTAALAALLRFQLTEAWVAVGWAAMTVALFAVSRRGILRTLRNQSYILALLTGARCAFDNFYRTSVWRFTNTRTITVAFAALLLYILFAITQLARREEPTEPEATAAEPKRFAQLVHAWRWLQANPRYLFFFLPTLLVTVLVSLEVRTSYLTAAWGVEALIIFLAVYKLNERAYRWFSLILFLMCVARIVVFDVWTLDALGRIVSFMGLGAALLAVSFLYARHREVLRRML